MTPGEIIVTNVRPGVAPVVVACNVQVGDIKIYGVTVRKGRGHAIYVNLPRQWRDRRWTPAVTITAHDLLDAVRHVVVIAAVEATRYSEGSRDGATAC